MQHRGKSLQNWRIGPLPRKPSYEAACRATRSTMQWKKGIKRVGDCNFTILPELIVFAAWKKGIKRVGDCNIYWNGEFVDDDLEWEKGIKRVGDCNI